MQELRRTLGGCLAVIAAIAVCGSGMFFTLDRVCVNYLPQRLPFYPNGDVRWLRHNFITPWGVGNTVTILDTADSPDVVRAWYGRETGTFLRRIASTDEPLLIMGQRLARADWRVDRAETGGGSMITLFGTCAN
ncbi:MAG: hypothetical protein SF162_10720 [bacterium]|nr:hypothetical protein [bacterium]